MRAHLQERSKRSRYLLVTGRAPRGGRHVSHNISRYMTLFKCCMCEDAPGISWMWSFFQSTFLRTLILGIDI